MGQSLKSSRTLILASTSPYRKKLLERLQIPFTTAASHVDESLVKKQGDSPQRQAVILARQKAQAVLQKYPRAVVIGSDQVALVGDTVLDKPGTEENARTQLSLLSGKTHQLLTAVCVLSSEKMQEWLEITELTMRELSPQEIADYVKAEPALDCGGSYKIEGLGISLFTQIKGSDPTAIEGLPLISLSAVLRDLKITSR